MKRNNVRYILFVLLFAVISLSSTCSAKSKKRSYLEYVKRYNETIKSQTLFLMDDKDASTLDYLEAFQNSPFTMGPIRIFASYRGITHSHNQCHESTCRMTCHQSNSSGATIQCSLQSNRTELNTLTKQKVNIIANNIIPGINAILQNGPLIYNLIRPLIVPEEVLEKCSSFHIPKDHFKGVHNADVVMYITANQMRPGDEHKLALAVPCASVDGLVIAIGLNLNPLKIMEIENITKAASEEVQQALGIHECSRTPSVLLKSTTNSGKKHVVCLHMKCGGFKSKIILYKNASTWVECINGMAILSSGDHKESISMCPKVDDICNDPMFNTQLRSLNAKLKPIRILASLLDLQDPTKYCPEIYEKKVLRPTFRGFNFNCVKSQNARYSETLTDEKKKLLIDTIIPQLLSSFEKNPLILSHEETLHMPRSIFWKNNACSNFTVPRSDYITGFNNTDLVLYISAGPMQLSERDAIVWAEPCVSKNGHLIAIAMNFDPAQILDNNKMLEKAKKVLSRTLGTLTCPLKNAILLPSAFQDSSIPGACVNIKCEADGKLLVWRRELHTWNECPEGAVLNQTETFRKQQSMVQIVCPKYESVCSNTSEKLQSELEFVSAFTTLRQSERYVIRLGTETQNVLADGTLMIAPFVVAICIEVVLTLL